jgi:hypothetical protein
MTDDEKAQDLRRFAERWEGNGVLAKTDVPECLRIIMAFDQRPPEIRLGLKGTAPWCGLLTARPDPGTGLGGPGDTTSSRFDLRLILLRAHKHKKSGHDVLPFGYLEFLIQAPNLPERKPARARYVEAKPRLCALLAERVGKTEVLNDPYFRVSHWRVSFAAQSYRFTPSEVRSDPLGFLERAQTAIRDLHSRIGDLYADPRFRSCVDDFYGADGPALVPSEKEISVTNVAELWTHLREKRAVVLQGPPGTGKTHLARQLVKALLAGGGGRTADPGANAKMPESFSALYRSAAAGQVPTLETGKERPAVVHEIVQMHPGYAYEDFVQGLRSKLNEAGFEARDQIFVQMARAARDAPETPFILILDEMNRCNPPSVFGELLYLLERTDRDRSVRLQYDGVTLALPEKLYLIGTMNSADRNIALVDFAIRRRFRFLTVPTDEQGRALKEFYGDRQFGQTAASAWTEFWPENLKLPSTHRLGPAFFMVPDDMSAGEDVDALARNIAFELIPQLLEYREEGVPGADKIADIFGSEVRDGADESVWKSIADRLRKL